MVTITDIAKRAKVSTSTVSRTLNDEQYVAPATAQAVKTAMKELGYVPRLVRPGPKTAKSKGVRTGAIAFLSVGQISPQAMYGMPAFPALLGGIQRGVEQRGMELVLSHMPDPEVLPKVLAHNRVDGALLFGDPPPAGPLKETVRRIPAVGCFLGDAEPLKGMNHVLYDNSHVGQLAAEYLLERGHRNLAYVGDELSHRAFVQRRSEFTRKLEECDVVHSVIEDAGALPGKLGQYAGALVDRLVELRPRPTGVFCVTADLMLAITNGLRLRGIEPQRDIELIGCNNDSAVMNQMHPRPATIDIKLDVVGEVAVEQLMWRMANPGEAHRGNLLIAPEVIPGELLADVVASSDR